MEERERELFDLVEPEVATQGVDLVEVSLAGGRRRAVVRVVVHSEAGITHGDCARVTRVLGRLLDGSRALPGRYVLEVSSPGTDRVLKAPREFDVFRGRAIWVRLAGGTEEIAGRAAGSRGGSVALVRDDGSEEVLPWSEVARARLAPEKLERGTGRG